MNYIMPNFATKAVDHTIYHHHKIEIVQRPQQEKIPEEETLKDRVREVVSYALIIVGALFALAAASAIALQSIGYIYGVEIGSLFMPSIGTMLMGFNIFKGEMKPAAKVNVPTGIPGVTLSA